MTRGGAQITTCCRRGKRLPGDWARTAGILADRRFDDLQSNPAETRDILRRRITTPVWFVHLQVTHSLVKWRLLGRLSYDDDVRRVNAHGNYG